MSTLPIGIFDSGIGGKTVLRSCRDLLPHERFVYVSDARAGGWGSLPVRDISARVNACVERLQSYSCKAIVAACNTATAVFIDTLRGEFEVPFVGVEPAVLPAVRAYPAGKIVVLCTPATARQKRLQRLLRLCGNARVEMCPQPSLAQAVEHNIHDLAALRPQVEEIVHTTTPDALVLGCTHYVFLRPLFAEWIGDERIFDGNDGVARRLQWVLSSRGALAPSSSEGSVLYDTVP